MDIPDESPVLKAGEEKEIRKQGLKKKLVKEGEVHFRGTLLEGIKFDSSRDRGTAFKSKLGQGQVIKGWDQGIITMKKGENAIFTIPPELDYGESGSPPTIPPNATLHFDVELLSWSSVMDICKYDFDCLSILSREQVIDGLDRAVMTMKKGEVALVTIAPEYAFSSVESKQDLAVFAPNSTVFYEVELVALVKVYKRYRHYYQWPQDVVTSFESVAGLSILLPLTLLWLSLMSKHFRCLKNAITDQVRFTSIVLAEDSSGKEENQHFGHVDQYVR